MGNHVSYKPIYEHYKMTTQLEMISKRGFRKYEGCGNTFSEALNRLTEVCEIYGIPTPRHVPNDIHTYYCGIISINTVFNKEKKFNTVFFTNIGNKYIAHIYYYITKHDF